LLKPGYPTSLSLGNRCITSAIVIRNQYSHFSTIFEWIGVASHCKVAVFMHTNCFAALAITELPLVFEVVGNCPVM
jgi:hypothetical protein